MTVTRQTNDIDDQSALLHGWNQSYAQLSRGAFAGSLTEATIGSAYLFREVTSQSLFQSGYVGPDHLAVGVPAPMQGASRFCGQRCDGGQIHLFSGREGFDFHTPTGLDMIGVVIPRALVGVAPVQPRLLTSPSAPALRDLMATLIAASDGPMQAAMLGDLVEALKDILAEGETPEPRRPDALARIRDLVESRSEGDEPPDVEEMCAAAAMSRRSLQNLFSAELGMRPSHYVRALRLNAARKRIRSGGSVTEAATAFGFWHFGRFAQDYRLQFGELPSQTRAN